MPHTPNTGKRVGTRRSRWCAPTCRLVDTSSPRSHALRAARPMASAGAPALAAATLPTALVARVALLAALVGEGGRRASRRGAGGLRPPRTVRALGRAAVDVVRVGAVLTHCPTLTHRRARPRGSPKRRGSRRWRDASAPGLRPRFAAPQRATTGAKAASGAETGATTTAPWRLGISRATRSQGELGAPLANQPPVGRRPRPCGREQDFRKLAEERVSRRQLPRQSRVPPARTFFAPLTWPQATRGPRWPPMALSAARTGGAGSGAPSPTARNGNWQFRRILNSWSSSNPRPTEQRVCPAHRSCWSSPLPWQCRGPSGIGCPAGRRPTAPPL